MKFEEALKNLKEGKKIRRKNNCGWVAFNNGNLLRYDLSSSRIGELVKGNDSFSLADVLADDWEVVEEKKKWWKPEKRTQYYVIHGDGDVERICYTNNPSDNRAIFMGNCFKTEEEAKFMVEKLKVIHELEKFAFENNEEEIMSYFKNLLKAKYFLRIEIRSKKLEVVSSPTHEYLPFHIYFDSEEIAKKAIETIGEDRIKKYYFGVKEE